MTNDKASDMFVRAVCDGSSMIIECEFCGRVHYCPNDGDWDDQHLRSINRQREATPALYVVHDAFIHKGQLGGKTWVPDCVCKQGRAAAAHTEQTWWDDRYQFVDYLELRSRAMRTQTKQAEELAAKGRAAL